MVVTHQQTIVEEMELLGAESVREVIRSLLVDDCIYARAITFEQPSLFSAPEPFDPIVLPGTHLYPHHRPAAMQCVLRVAPAL